MLAVISLAPVPAKADAVLFIYPTAVMFADNQRSAEIILTNRGDGAGYTATAVASATLKIGATLTGDNTATAGNADGSFDVTVTYQ